MVEEECEVVEGRSWRENFNEGLQVEGEFGDEKEKLSGVRREVERTVFGNGGGD